MTIFRVHMQKMGYNYALQTECPGGARTPRSVTPKGLASMPSNDTIEIHLTNGFVAIVDRTDADLVSPYRWHAEARSDGKSNTVYATANVKGRTVRMHRLILDAQSGQLVDHIDRNGLNNRRSNLRIATESQQRANMPPRRNTASGYKGVFRASSGGKWRASITFDGRKFDLGSFDTPEDAAREYDKHAVRLYGDFAWLNFPELTESPEVA